VLSMQLAIHSDMDAPMRSEGETFDRPALIGHSGMHIFLLASLLLWQRLNAMVDAHEDMCRCMRPICTKGLTVSGSTCPLGHRTSSPREGLASRVRVAFRPHGLHLRMPQSYLASSNSGGFDGGRRNNMLLSQLGEQ